MASPHAYLPGTVVAVTPDDDDECNALGLFVGTGGDVAVLPAGNTASVIFANVPDGSFLPCQVKKVLATGTTASDILALS